MNKTYYGLISTFLYSFIITSPLIFFSYFLQQRRQFRGKGRGSMVCWWTGQGRKEKKERSCSYKLTWKEWSVNVARLAQADPGQLTSLSPNSLGLNTARLDCEDSMWILARSPHAFRSCESMAASLGRFTIKECKIGINKQCRNMRQKQGIKSISHQVSAMWLALPCLVL